MEKRERLQIEYYMSGDIVEQKKKVEKYAASSIYEEAQAILERMKIRKEIFLKEWDKANSENNEVAKEKTRLRVHNDFTIERTQMNRLINGLKKK